MKKVLSLVLALMMILSLATTAFAADETGSITIKSAANVSVEGKTFNAYKILNLELVGEEGYVYTIPAELEAFYAEEFGLDVNSGDFDYEVTQKIAEMTNDSKELFAFAAKALAAAKAAGITPATATGAEDAASVLFENLPLGYYVIEDVGTATPISALVLDSTNPDIVATLKADKPELEKKIDGDKDTDDTTTGLVDFNNAAIGDTVPYVLTSAVPNMTGYTKYFYVVTDTLSAGLTFNNDVAITVGDKTLVKDTDFTVEVTNNADGTTTVVIVFKDFIQYTAGDEIKITYSAILNEDAVIGVEGNPNIVRLDYSNNPNVTPEGDSENPDKPGADDPIGTTPDDITYTYVTDLIIEKVDANGNHLEGAEFTLTGEKLNKVIVLKDVYTKAEDGTYWKLTDGTYTTDAPTEETQSKYVSTTVKYSMETVTEVITVTEEVNVTAAVGSDGLLKFEGLSAGEYTITEITAPAGYNLLDDPITVTITWTAPAEGSTECTWTYSEPAVENTVTIVNQAGTQLPETGGIGTTLFYIVGGVLVLAAVVLLVTKKRMLTAE